MDGMYVEYEKKERLEDDLKGSSVTLCPLEEVYLMNEMKNRQKTGMSFPN